MRRHKQDIINDCQQDIPASNVCRREQVIASLVLKLLPPS